MKKIIASCIIGFVVVISSVSIFASTYNTPSEAVAALTGQSEEEILAKKETGQTYGAIANQAGKLEEFKQVMLEICQERVNAAVANGSMNQEQATTIVENKQQRQANCDGTGNGYATNNSNATNGVTTDTPVTNGNVTNTTDNTTNNGTNATNGYGGHHRNGGQGRGNHNGTHGNGNHANGNHNSNCIYGDGAHNGNCVYNDGTHNSNCIYGNEYHTECIYQ